MPDFDTRTPPQGPSRLSKFHTYAGGLWRTLTRHRRRWAEVRHRWLSAAGERVLVGIEDSGMFLYRHRLVAGLGSFFLIGCLIWLWLGYDPVHHPSYDQMPEYSRGTFDPADCPYVTFTETEGNILCYYAITDARDPELLALVTADVVGEVSEVQVVQQVEFYESNPYAGVGTEMPYATGLVFASKDAADTAPVLLSEATHWHGAYVFEGDPEL